MAGLRGFASMDRDRVREIASMGGRAADLKGTGRRWTVEQAREAGSKGGRITRANRLAQQAAEQQPATITSSSVGRT